jgi:hypothetical protein
MRGEDHTLLRNIAWGLGWALKFIVAYSLLGTVIFFMAGPGKVPLSLTQLLGTYFVVGLSAGIIVGLLRPFSRRQPGAIAIGMIVAAVIYLGVAISVEGPGVLREPGPVVALLLAACVVGGLSGRKWWNESRDISAMD